MKYSKELKIGFFVVLVLVVSFFVINYLRGKDIFNNEIDLVGQFENVEGLAESAPVFKSTVPPAAAILAALLVVFAPFVKSLKT